MTVDPDAVAPVKPRAFAIIPAAGHSRRMGSPKLLLPYQGATVIDHVLDTWSSADVEEIVVVCRRLDQPLIACCEKHDCTILQPAIDPPDMKASVLLALDYLYETRRPRPEDAWLLTPADSPTIQPTVIKHLLQEYRNQARIESANPARDTIFAPVFKNRRGHPVLFPWNLVEAARNIPPDQGINQLLQRFPVQEVPVDTGSILQDLDTPADYQQLRKDCDPSIRPPDAS